MRIIKTLVVASALIAGGSAAFAEGVGNGAYSSQGATQSALAFTQQAQGRSLVGEFARETTQSITQRPGSVNSAEFGTRGAYGEPMAIDNSVR